MFAPILKVRGDLKKWEMERINAARKAKQVALAKTSYHAMKVSRDDLKRGNLSLRKLSWLSNRSDPRAGRFKGKKARLKERMNRAPLTSLFRGITFYVDKNRLYAEVGFRGIGGTAWQAKLAEKSVPGYRWGYTERFKRYLHRIGIHLRKTTMAGTVPSRNIISAVIEKRGNELARMLKDYFERKLRGERI